MKGQSLKRDNRITDTRYRWLFWRNAKIFRSAGIFAAVLLGITQISCAAQMQQGIGSDNAVLNEKEGATQCFKLLPPRRVYAQSKQDMCRALEAQLNDMCGNNGGLCGLQFSGEGTSFLLPAWQTLDIDQYRDRLVDLVRGRIARFEPSNPGMIEREVDAVLRSLQARNPTGTRVATLKKATIDIFNRGVPEDVYALKAESCDSKISDWESLGSFYYVGRDSEVLLNSEMRAQADRGRSPYPGSDQIGTSRKDVFIYRNRTYVMNWGAQPYVSEIVSSKIPSADPDSPIEMVGAIPICEFGR